ncbi:hypothetical protein B9G69_012995 [Bdellovibrio sp. SKB1291214]|uniref:hypothetical protein n=1 Tax=Bdellovibrio sp. SKB1291214 TaxID=1732569 RepID=UPI0011311F64|nr:hypothetical protein [Bdellovibrio sp. SKB1291214]UYL07964.1 hypothetical protein B9G69_012995 [Bdellovibrio sp. SKB1291214]
MCKTTLILFFAFASVVWATPRTKADLLADLKSRREKAAGLDFTKTSEEFKKAFASVKAAVDNYKKLKNPVLTEAEEQVLYVSYSMEPVNSLVGKSKPTAQDCDKAKRQIILEDKGTKPEDSTLSSEATEASAWLALLCK